MPDRDFKAFGADIISVGPNGRQAPNDTCSCQ